MTEPCHTGPAAHVCGACADHAQAEARRVPFPEAVDLVMQRYSEAIKALGADHPGWTTMAGQPPGSATVHVRSVLGEDGRRVITDLHVHGPHLTAETLRGISLPRIEAALNQPAGRAAERSAGVLRRPDGTDPDHFYREVAVTYGLHAAKSNAPARLIAEEADVPVTTVHRWIREARRRGFLPPGRKGRTG